MSSDESNTTSSSRLRQLGLYRTIDSRTEEFLKLSRRRQIRQGCACAAVSTAITVTVVVVILLIYEYAIAVDSSLVQSNLLYSNINASINGTDDNPVADRLDRSYFGFDQDYYERMPLLVNAMQENHYVDPILEMTLPSNKRSRILKTDQTKTTTLENKTPIRRTSPRPFIFEYRSPTPTPFSRAFASKTWVESYRNAQRLQNLQQVIHYLEKTINAKFGDLYALPSSTHIAFSGVYVQPSSETISKDPKPTPLDLLLQGSNRVETIKTNHLADPYFSFKPDNPGDVNLLADNFLRFAPLPTSINKDKSSTKIPMFRSISYRKKQESAERDADSQKSASEIKNIESSSIEKPNSFSVMLNYVPHKTTIHTDYNLDDGTQSAINKIYFTTARPVRVQFKRKSAGSIRRMSPFIRPVRKPNSAFKPTLSNADVLRKSGLNKEATMIVHVNLYPQNITPEVKKEIETVTETVQTTTLNTYARPLTPAPDVSVTQVEDFHVGSSGVIPVEVRTSTTTTTTPRPVVTTMMPFFDTTVTSTEIYPWSTSPPDIIKFSPEDAKVPDQYRHLQMEASENPVEIHKRNFREDLNEDKDVEPQTLIAKLRNEIKSTTEETISDDMFTGTDETTTVQTYVPQINGHYRSVNQNSRNINDWLHKDEESDRKRRLEITVTGVRKPTYVEIKRNHTNKETIDD